MVLGTRIQIKRERSVEKQKSTSIPIKNQFSNPLASIDLATSEASSTHLAYQSKPVLTAKLTIGNGNGNGTKTSIVTDVDDDDELELSNFEAMIKDADIIDTLNQFVFILFLVFCLSLNFFGLYFAPYYVKRPLSIDED